MEKNFRDANGIICVKDENGYSHIECKLKPEHLNHRGIPHGGFIFSMMDCAAGRAAYLTEEEGLYRIVVTQEASASFIKGVTCETVHAYGNVIHCGRSSILVDVEVKDENDVVFAVGRIRLFTIGFTHTNIYSD